MHVAQCYAVGAQNLFISLSGESGLRWQSGVCWLCWLYTFKSARRLGQVDPCESEAILVDIVSFRTLCIALSTEILHSCWAKEDLPQSS